jgi:hypothetical protein
VLKIATICYQYSRVCTHSYKVASSGVNGRILVQCSEVSKWRVVNEVWSAVLGEVARWAWYHPRDSKEYYSVSCPRRSEKYTELLLSTHGISTRWLVIVPSPQLEIVHSSLSPTGTST